MSDIEDNVRWAHEAYYLAETGEHLGSAMQVDPSHDAAIRAVIKATREQVAQELLSGLPAALITTARDEDGWASDMQDAQLRLVNDGWVAFCGEGAVDIRHIAEHAALIARGES